MDLVEKMIKMTYEHGRTCGQPSIWLLHEDDYEAINDITKREQEESRYHPGNGVYLRGIPCMKSLIAAKGKPILAFEFKG